jgi:hypothetical protein
MQAITTIGLDIAKSVFQVHGVDAAGQVVMRRQLKRRYVLKFFEKLPPSKPKWLAISTRHPLSCRPPFLSSIASSAAVLPGHDLPARGKSHPINFWYGLRRNFWFGLRRLRWNSFCWAAFLANAATCSSVCRLSFGRVIHSRMIFRRVSWSSMLAVP